ncbi:MAG: hypothetical protein V4523_01625 [Pseudomonadota bacterium]
MEYFTPFDLQPLGNTPLAQEFTLALIHSSLFAALLILANRAVLPAALACVPLNIVTGYWNSILDPGVVEYAFGIVTLLLNAILLWPWRSELIGLAG